MKRAKIFIGFALGLTIGLLIGYGFLSLYANHQMEKRGYASFKSLMKTAGFNVEKKDGLEAICYNSERGLVLEVEKGCKIIRLNDNTYTLDKVFYRTMNVLYVDVSYMESLLEMDVKRKEGIIPWTSKYRVIYYDSKVNGSEGETGAESEENSSDVVENESLYEDVGGDAYLFQKIQTNVEKSLDTSLIAHAGGGFLLTTIEDTDYMLRYTNTKESVINSIQNGFKMVELDFLIAEDGVLCAVHKWDNKKERNDSTVFLSDKYADVLTKMNLEDTLKLFNDYPDVSLILDIRIDNGTESITEEIYRNIYSMAMEIGGNSLAKRVIPQIYHPWQYFVLKKIYNWGSIIFTLYKEKDMSTEEIVEFVKDKDDIQIVTIPKATLTEEMIQGLHGVNKRVFTHTINGLNKMNSWKKKGVDGFYTDIITPEMFYEKFGSY